MGTVSRFSNLSVVDLNTLTVVAALSGIGKPYLRLFDSIDGDLIMEKQLHSFQDFSPGQLSVLITFLDDDVLVLTDGHTLSRIDRSTGEVTWAWTSPDAA